MSFNRHLLPAALAAAVLTLGGCISAGTVSHLITDAPNGGHPEPFPGVMGKIARSFYSEQFKVTVGPPAATLSAAIIAPRNYDFSVSDQPGDEPDQRVVKWRVGPEHKHTRAVDKLDGRQVDRMLHNLQAALAQLPYCTPAGTIIILPGWGVSKEMRLGSALDFANHGYRVVLVDLRGQGDSSGKHIGYGLIEHQDIIQLITALEARGMIAGRLALFGVSVGAVTALDTAAADSRVDAVVAVAPFTSFATAARGVGNDFAPLLSDLVSKQKLDKAIRLADKRTGLRLAAADPLPRVHRIRAKVLYVAGGDDDIAPADGVRALAAATPDARYVEFDRHTHMDTALAIDRLVPHALATLHETLGASPDPGCLKRPLPAALAKHYEFTVSVKYRLGGKKD